jgi:hypothetical protein
MVSDDDDKKPKKPPAKVHPKVFRHGRSLSSSRLVKTSRIGPLHNLEEEIASPPTSDSTSDSKEKFNRSKSSDSLASRRTDSSRRVAPLSTIRVSRSQTKMAKHSPSARLSHIAGSRHQRAKEPVIQLDQDETDDDDQEDQRHSDSSYEDVPDSVTSSTATQKDEFKPLLLPNSPAPPKLSTETVVAIAADSSPPKQQHGETLHSLSGPTLMGSPPKATSWADLHRVSSRKSNEVSSPTSTIMASSPTTRTQQKLWLQRQNMEEAMADSSTVLSPEKKREFERITKEYINVRKYTNPVIDSIERTRTLRSGVPRAVVLLNDPKHRNTSAEVEGLSQSLPKRVTSLSATTLNSMANLNLEDNPYNDSWHKDITSHSAATAAAIGTVPYLLNKIWNEGWKDFSEVSTTPSEESQSISSQALQAQQQLSAGSRQRAQAPGMNRIKIV